MKQLKTWKSARSGPPRRREYSMSKDLEQPLNPVSDDIVIAKPALSAGAAEAAERRGLIVSMVTLVISIPALIGA